jgi:soluble lytic murein transglycosylase
LSDYRAWLLARAALAMGEREKARGLLEGLGRDPPEVEPCRGAPTCRHPLFMDVSELRAKSFEGSAPKKGAQILAELPPDPRLLQHAVELYRAAGDDKGAQKVEARILIEAADSPEAHAIAETLGRAGVAQRLGSEDRRLARIFRLLDTHDNEGALGEAESMIGELPKKSSSGCQLLYVEGKALRKMRQYGRSIDALSKARKECARVALEPVPKGKGKTATSSTSWALRRDTATNFEMRSSLLETEVRAIRGDIEGTRKTALWIADNHKTHPFADDALFFLGDLLEQRGMTDDARKIYKRIVEEHGEGDLAPEASWRIAFDAIKSSDRAGAESGLDEIEHGPFSRTLEGARARYWHARVQETEAEKACSGYGTAALEPAMSFYAFLAVDRLDRVDPACSAKLKEKLLALRGPITSSTSTNTVVPSLASAPPYRRALKLARIPGFQVYASLELGLLRTEAMSEEDLVALALAFEQISDHREAQLLLRTRGQRALAVFPTGAAGQVWRAAYSRPFEEEISAAAEEQGVDPWLLFALAREESTFDPAVISWAGAVGLAQLMPATAAGAYASLGLGHLDVQKLTDPGLNLRLGARVLRDNLRYFTSSVPLALAAYNGGSGLVDKNLPPEQADFDRWVESIPVKETRKYVKRVLQSYGIYRFLYDRQHPFIDLPDTVAPHKKR